MFDDPGDIDRNGIPDAIQRDPVIAPPEPVRFGEPSTESGLPGIDTPIEPTADATPALPEQPVLPAAPGPDAGPADLARYQQEMERYNLQMQMISDVLQTMDETSKNIIRNLRG